MCRAMLNATSRTKLRSAPPPSPGGVPTAMMMTSAVGTPPGDGRSEEHTSELQSHHDLVCRLLLEKKKNKHTNDSRRLAKRKCADLLLVTKRNTTNKTNAQDTNRYHSFSST